MRKETGARQIDTEQYLTLISRIIADGGQAAIPVRGDSMRPFLSDGKDAVLLGPVSAGKRKVRRGDIVLYQRESGQFVLHRVVRTDRSGPSEYSCQMRGDAQSVMEGPVRSGQIRARVLRVKRGGKWISRWSPCALFFRHLWCRRWFPRGKACALYGRYKVLRAALDRARSVML